MKAIAAARTLILQGATIAAAAANTAATGTQLGWNAAILASPIFWIPAIIIAVIVAIIALANWIAKTTGIATTGFGVITGAINVAIQFFHNLRLMAINVLIGIGSAAGALGSNIITAFKVAIAAVQARFYDLLSTALSVVGKIAEALNKLPFVEFDYSGLSSAADNYASKSAALYDQASNTEFESITDAFNKGMNTFDTFGDGWISDAFSSGAAWGDGVVGDLTKRFKDFFGGGEDNGFNMDDYQSSVEDYLGGIKDDTGAIKDGMELTEEDLKYLRDIAEREVVNRYTTAEIIIDQSGMQNNISSNMDIDGFVSGLTDSVNEAIDSITEGVHP